MSERALMQSQVDNTTTIGPTLRKDDPVLRFDLPDSELKSIFSAAPPPLESDTQPFSRTPGPGLKRGIAGDDSSWDDPSAWKLEFSLFTNRPTFEGAPYSQMDIKNLASTSPDMSSIIRMISTPQGEGSGPQYYDAYHPSAREPQIEEAHDMDRLVADWSQGTSISAHTGVHIPPNSANLKKEGRVPRADRYKPTNIRDLEDGPSKYRSSADPGYRYHNGGQIGSGPSGSAPSRPMRVVADRDIEFLPTPIDHEVEIKTRKSTQSKMHYSAPGNLGPHMEIRRDANIARSLDSDSGQLSVQSSIDRIGKIQIQTIFGSGSKPLADLVESPRSKLAFKDFSNDFRAKWKISPQEAEAHALEVVDSMPEHAQWRVYVELAELAKKLDDAEKAREYYIRACEREHRASMIWLEWSKMEEENGKPDDALAVLAYGLTLCRVAESLLPRIVKLMERRRRFDSIRRILSNFKHEHIDRTWKLLLEGCLFEAREGRSEVSRNIFRYLMKHVHWHGPIYYEAFRLEEREGRERHAKSIAISGLRELKHYGPLWFGLMRLIEREDISAERRLWIRGEEPQLALLTNEIKDASVMISKELTWRVHFERFQAEERAAEIAALGLYRASSNRSLQWCRRQMLSSCRRSLAQSLLLCPASPNNLRWRLFLVGARLELGVGNIAEARSLLKRAFAEVPHKSIASVIIECSRLEEYTGRAGLAREILIRSRNEMNHDWKGYLEQVLLEARAGNFQQAIDVCEEAVAVHPGTGRLWALCIQLHHRLERISMSVCGRRNPRGSLSAKQRVIRRAIAEVPKSGEVWCEHARCLLNPFQLQAFDMGQAIRALNFAITFTPQYGDSFVEYIRLELLHAVTLRQLCKAVGLDHIRFANAFLNDDEDNDIACSVDRLDEDSSHEIPLSAETLAGVLRDIHHLQFPFSRPKQSDIKLERLERRCINADPNYGSAWFHCRQFPHDIPTAVLNNAKSQILHELLDSQRIYGRALLHYVRRCLASQPQRLPNRTLRAQEAAFLKAFDSCRMESEEVMEPHSIILEDRGTWFCSSDFVTGLVDMNRTIFNPRNSAELRRRYLFGTDQIIN